MVLSVDEIRQATKQITSSGDRKQYNKILRLVGQYEQISGLEETKFFEIESNLRFLTLSLKQIFTKFFKLGQLNPSLASNDNEKQLFLWCRKVYGSFKARLLEVISSTRFENSLALDCLDVYIQLLELESIYFASKPEAAFFPNKTLKALIAALFQSSIPQSIDAATGHSTDPVLQEFSDKYYQKFVDLQYYFQAELSNLIRDGTLDKLDHSQLLAKWLSLVNHDNHYSSAEAELDMYVPQPPQAMESETQFKANLEQNYLWFLGRDGLLNCQYKTLLLILHKRIIPHFATPTKLMDFLTDSYDVGNGVISILALNGLFELMRRYNLEYPNFYVKLYQLVTVDLMHVKYRSRFIRMTDLFLSSTHISAGLVASFIKRFARLTLDSPPSAIISVIPLVYNLIKRHPSCMVMLHDPDFMTHPFATPEELALLKQRKSDYKDPFDMNEPNPEHTRAIESSLWELASLTNHYHPNIATLAKIFSQPFKKPSYNLEDFLDWTYDSLLKAETTKKIKVLPALEFEEMGQLFGTYIEGVQW
ncbi:LAMI_0H04346g1_1 [Lachancea mirantina]|uniref:LAMI_0H04346g1_1 n=1 Tax=Lachancea mirantina TaxID=1230905 RepID=A0A1G4KF18_9SACH|nr:LAMI_0H04346g1_1 [Lachancea mirantina]